MRYYKDRTGLFYYDNIHPSVVHETKAALVVRAGSCVENKNERGLAHLIEHMNAIGISFLHIRVKYAYTQFNETVYFFDHQTIDEMDCSLFAAYCEQTARSILAGDYLTEETFSQARSEVIREYHRTDMRKLDAIRELFRPDGYDLRLPIGDLDTINRFGLSDAFCFHNRWYSPKNAAFIVASGTENKKTEQSKINSNYIFLISKLKRDVGIFERYIEESVCLHIALDAIRIASAPFGNINVSTEIFLPGWHLIHLRVETDKFILSKEDLTINIKNLYINDQILAKAKQSFAERVNKYPTDFGLIDINDILQECIMHFLYGEPMVDVEEERKKALFYLDRIVLDEINDVIKKIIKEMK